MNHSNKCFSPTSLDYNVNYSFFTTLKNFGFVWVRFLLLGFFLIVVIVWDCIGYIFLFGIVYICCVFIFGGVCVLGGA